MGFLWNILLNRLQFIIRFYLQSYFCFRQIVMLYWCDELFLKYYFTAVIFLRCNWCGEAVKLKLQEFKISKLQDYPAKANWRQPKVKEKCYIEKNIIANWIRMQGKFVKTEFKNAKFLLKISLSLLKGEVGESSRL